MHEVDRLAAVAAGVTATVNVAYLVDDLHPRNGAVAVGRRA